MKLQFKMSYMSNIDNLTWEEKYDLENEKGIEIFSKSFPTCRQNIEEKKKGNIVEDKVFASRLCNRQFKQGQVKQVFWTEYADKPYTKVTATQRVHMIEDDDDDGECDDALNTEYTRPCWRSRLLKKERMKNKVMKRK